MTPAPPRWRHEYASLAMVARDVAAKRHRDYPALVAAGRLAHTAAAWALFLADAVAADWTLIAGGQGREGERTPHRRATLDQAHARCLRLADLALAALDGPARKYADLAGPDLVRRDLLDGLLEGEVAAGLGRWIDAVDYAELVGTLAWWERQPLFPRLLIGNARRRAAVLSPNVLPADALPAAEHSAAA